MITKTEKKKINVRCFQIYVCSDLRAPIIKYNCLYTFVITFVIAHNSPCSHNNIRYTPPPLEVETPHLSSNTFWLKPIVQWNRSNITTTTTATTVHAQRAITLCNWFEPTSVCRLAFACENKSHRVIWPLSHHPCAKRRNRVGVPLHSTHTHSRTHALTRSLYIHALRLIIYGHGGNKLTTMNSIRWPHNMVVMALVCASARVVVIWQKGCSHILWRPIFAVHWPNVVVLGRMVACAECFWIQSITCDTIYARGASVRKSASDTHCGIGPGIKRGPIIDHIQDAWTRGLQCTKARTCPLTHQSHVKMFHA